MRPAVAALASLALAQTRPRGMEARNSRRRSLLRHLRLLAILPVLAWWPGCGGGGGAPTEPVQAPPFASNLDFVITPMVNNGTVVEFSWSGTASEYRLEIGASPSASDVATFDTGPTRSFTWSSVPIGTFYARVRGRQGTTVGVASSEVLVGSIDARQMIDALIFGRGPLAVAGNPAGPSVPDRMSGWQPGTQFGVILGESVPSAFATAAEATVQQVGPATQGAVQATMIGRQPDPLRTPGPGEVTISAATQQDINTACECDNCIGCTTRWVRGSFIQRAIIQASSAAPQSGIANSLGFVIGLAHIISPAGVRPPFTMGVTTDGKYLPSGQVSALDPATLRMLGTIYGAGLTAGSSRHQFEAAGFVPPQSESAAPPAAPSLRPPRYVVRQEGDETVVIELLYLDRSVGH